MGSGRRLDENRQGTMYLGVIAMTWTIARCENQGDAAFVGVLDIHVGNARIERTTPHDVDLSILAMCTYICIILLLI